MTSHPPPIEPEGLLDGLQWPAILGGAVLDNVLTVLAMIPLTLLLAGKEGLAEDEEAAGRALDQATASPEFLALAAVCGLAITVYAAFWVARRAGTLHVRHGGWTAVASALLGTLLLLVPGAGEGPQPPVWYDALGLVCMLPAGLLGGWLAFRLAETADR